MSHDDRKLVVLRYPIGADDVLRVVHRHVFPAVFLKPLLAEGRPRSLVMRGRRDGAQLPDELLQLFLRIQNILLRLAAQTHG